MMTFDEDDLERELMPQKTKEKAKKGSVPASASMLLPASFVKIPPSKPNIVIPPAVTNKQSVHNRKVGVASTLAVTSLPEEKVHHRSLMKLKGSMDPTTAMAQKKDSKRVTKKQSENFERNLHIQAATSGISVESLRELAEKTKTQVAQEQKTKKMIQKKLNLAKLVNGNNRNIDLGNVLREDSNQHHETATATATTHEDNGMAEIRKPKLPSARTKRLHLLTIFERRKLAELAFDGIDPRGKGVLCNVKLQALIDELKYLVSFISPDAEKREEELYLLVHGEKNAAEELREEAELEKHAENLSDVTDDDDEDDDDDGDDLKTFIASESDDEVAEIALDKVKKLVKKHGNRRYKPRSVLAITNQSDDKTPATLKKESDNEDEGDMLNASGSDDSSSDDSAIEDGSMDGNEGDDEVEPVDDYDAPRTTRSQASSTTKRERVTSPIVESAIQTSQQSRRRLKKKSCDSEDEVSMFSSSSSSSSSSGTSAAPTDPFYETNESSTTNGVKKPKKKLVVSESDNDQDMLGDDKVGTDISTVD